LGQDIVEWVIVSLTSVISLAMLSITNQRLSIGLLAGQYLGVFFFISLEWPLPLAITFLFAGWISGVILALALNSPAAPSLDGRPAAPNHPEDPNQDGVPALRSGQAVPPNDISAHALKNEGLAPRNEGLGQPRLTSSFFNLLVSFIIILACLSFAPQVNRWIPTLSPLQGWLALLLSGLGLIHLAINPHPIATVIAVLTILSGFEILYSGLTSTRLAVGLLACITLFIALSGSYLLLAPSMKESE